MTRIARNWRVLIGTAAAGSAVFVGFTGASASAEPVVPAPPAPAPATVTQTVTVTPQAAPAAAGAPAAAPAATPAVAAAAPAAAPAVAPAAVPAAVSAAPAVTPTPVIPPATSGTLAEFFKDKGVTLEPQKATGFTALNLVLPMPTGWSMVPDPNVPNAFTVIADRNGGDAFYTPNAQLIVYKLVGDFDPREAISHGYVESQQLPVWQSTSASMADFGGFPSSVISGTYREGDVTLNTSRRHVIATSGEDRYLVSLFVTTSANQVVATAAATDGIINGFRVTVPGATPAPVAAAPAATAVAPAAAAPVTDAAAQAVPAPAVAPAPAAVTAPAAVAAPAAVTAVAAPSVAALPPALPAR